MPYTVLYTASINFTMVYISNTGTLSGGLVGPVVWQMHASISNRPHRIGSPSSTTDHQSHECRFTHSVSQPNHTLNESTLPMATHTRTLYFVGDLLEGKEVLTVCTNSFPESIIANDERLQMFTGSRPDDGMWDTRCMGVDSIETNEHYASQWGE